MVNNHWPIRLFLLLLVFSALMPRSTESSMGHQTPTRPTSIVNYVVVIVLENQGINKTYGNCSANCTYITQLANQYGIALNYSGVAHYSLANYLALTTGKNFSYSPYIDNCNPTQCSISSTNLMDQIEASGRTWKAYIEDYTPIGGCDRTWISTDYEANHNPFLYYNDIYNNATRCQLIQDANPGKTGYLALPTALLSDLSSSVNAPNLMWLTPNDCDSGDGASNCPNIPSVAQANAYLNDLVPQILNSTVFQTRAASLFIVWDEGDTGYGGVCTTGGSGPAQTYPTCIDRVTAIWAGPINRQVYKSNTGFSHYSFSKTLETLWNLSPTTGQYAPALAMTDFFESSQPPSPQLGGGGRPLEL